MSQPLFEPCQWDRHHYPHLRGVRLPDVAEGGGLPFDPDEGVTVDFIQCRPIVCPGAGSDAMEVPT